MKHDLFPTTILLFLFLISQYLGIYIYASLPYVQMQKPNFIDILINLILAISLFLLLIKYKFNQIAKAWYFLSLVIGMGISLYPFFKDWSFIVAVCLSLIRFFSKDVFFHNFTEVLLYGGIAAIFASALTPISALILIIIVSIYDYISVFITKHMISIVKFQSSNNMFAGLYVPYRGETAILGGGDSVFALLFSCVLLDYYGIGAAYLNTIFSFFSLLILMIIGKKGKYYPAMPFIAAASILSLLIVNL